MSNLAYGRLLSILFFIHLCTTLQAQRAVVVCDIETRTPLRGVAVVTTEKYRDTTNYLGVCHLPVTFTEATFMRPNYIAYTLKPKNMADTILLLPAMNALTEVVVWGKDLRNKSIMSLTAAAKAAAASVPHPKTGVNFDAGMMFDRRLRRDKKHLKKAKEILKEWDKK